MQIKQTFVGNHTMRRSSPRDDLPAHRFLSACEHAQAGALAGGSLTGILKIYNRQLAICGAKSRLKPGFINRDINGAEKKQGDHH